MKRTLITLFLGFLYLSISAQNIVKGILIDSDSETPISGVSVSMKHQNFYALKTDEKGFFIFQKINNGAYVLEIKLQGYETQKFSIQLTGTTINLGSILLYKDSTLEQDLSTITITDDELNDQAFAL